MAARPAAGWGFYALAALLVVAGAVGVDVARALHWSLGPAELAIPFVLWQLAVWSFLVGTVSSRRARAGARGSPQRG